MVALEPGEPLLLYSTVTAEAVRWVPVTEQPEPLQLHAPKEAATRGSGSQDTEPVEEPRNKQAIGTQEPEAPPSPNPQFRS
jgi:hypothetical protein